MSEKTKVKASDHGSYGVLTIIAFLVPLVGLIMGAIYLTKDTKLDHKVGEHLIAVGVLSSIIASALWFFTFGSGLFTPSIVPVTSVPTTYQSDTTQTPTWDINSAYAKITTRMTKTAVETAINRTADHCTEGQQSGSDTYSTCTYRGGTSTDSEIIIVNYVNNVVTTKEKTNY